MDAAEFRARAVALYNASQQYRELATAPVQPLEPEGHRADLQTSATHLLAQAQWHATMSLFCEHTPPHPEPVSPLEDHQATNNLGRRNNVGPVCDTCGESCGWFGYDLGYQHMHPTLDAAPSDEPPPSRAVCDHCSQLLLLPHARTIWLHQPWVPIGQVGAPRLVLDRAEVSMDACPPGHENVSRTVTQTPPLSHTVTHDPKPSGTAT